VQANSARLKLRSGSFLNYHDLQSGDLMTEEAYNIQNINKVNQAMRRFGFIPSEIGESKMCDHVKLVLYWLWKRFP
jgi:hypothetical protein